MSSAVHVAAARHALDTSKVMMAEATEFLTEDDSEPFTDAELSHIDVVLKTVGLLLQVAQVEATIALVEATKEGNKR